MAKAKSLFDCNSTKLSRRLNVARSQIYRDQSLDARKFKDEVDLAIIKKLFFEKRQKVGIRQLKMLLFKRFKRVMNLKKIARLKKKYNLITQIRRKKPYQKFVKLQQEHKTTPNHLQRVFNQTEVDRVYSTDITQLNYGSGKKAYLAVFKDLATKEIVSSNVSGQIDLPLVNHALGEALKKLPKEKRHQLMIHSDQGTHFTHFIYRSILKENGVVQSMSRKGNCIDNAPVESFFGYIKDHLDLKSCKTLEALKTEVTKEIRYYNYERPQWDLKKMPPISYRRHLNLSRGLF